ncbi:MAG: fluoride efflux transporter CrcB, partial [Myxococcaceae bacterium]
MPGGWAGFLWVCLGGAVGSGARYVATLGAMRLFGVALWGTFAVNLLGSFLLGVIVPLALRGSLSEQMRLALGVGVMGGFTTYSTFNLEVLTLAQQGTSAHAALYAFATLVGCLAAGICGLWL